MGGAARCLMSVVCCGSVVGTVGGPPAQGGKQILGGTPKFQDSRCVWIERIVSDDIDSMHSTFRVHDVSYRVLDKSRVVPLIVLCLVTFSHLSRLWGFDTPCCFVSWEFPHHLCRLGPSVFRVTEVLLASREMVFGLWVLQFFWQWVLWPLVEIRLLCMSIAFIFCVTFDVHVNCPRSLTGWTTSEVFQCSSVLFPSVVLLFRWHFGVKVFATHTLSRLFQLSFSGHAPHTWWVGIDRCDKSTCGSGSCRGNSRCSWHASSDSFVGNPCVGRHPIRRVECFQWRTGRCHSGTWHRQHLHDGMGKRDRGHKYCH